MTPGCRIDELRVDPNLVTSAAHTALEDVSDPEILRHFPGCDGLALIGEGCVAGDDEEAGDLGQIRDQVLGHAIGEVVLLGLAAHVGERQDGNGRLIRQR